MTYYRQLDINVDDDIRVLSPGLRYKYE